MFCVYLSLVTFVRGLWIAKLQSQCITSRNNCIRTCGLNHVRLQLNIPVSGRGAKEI